MYRTLRLFFTVFGVCLFATTTLRAIQPIETTGIYPVIAAGQPDGLCCNVYIVTDRRELAQRVQVGVGSQLAESNPFFGAGIQAPVITNLISNSNDWLFVPVINNDSEKYAYMIPTDGGDPVRLSDEVVQGWNHYWSEFEDTLYYVKRDNLDGSALYSISPPATQPTRLTDNAFGEVRSINERGLPASDFAPYLLLFWCINLLFIAGGLRAWEKAYTPTPHWEGLNKEIKNI